MYDFGLLLKTQRKERGLTQKQLGDKLNVTEATISKYESNSAMPPFETMRSLAAIFNVSLDFLYGNEAAGVVSLYGLSDEQSSIIKDLATIFRAQNSGTRKKLSEDQYNILGRIIAAFMAAQ